MHVVLHSVMGHAINKLKKTHARTRAHARTHNHPKHL